MPPPVGLNGRQLRYLLPDGPAAVAHAGQVITAVVREWGLSSVAGEVSHLVGGQVAEAVRGGRVRLELRVRVRAAVRLMVCEVRDPDDDRPVSVMAAVYDRWPKPGHQPVRCFRFSP